MTNNPKEKPFELEFLDLNWVTPELAVASDACNSKGFDFLAKELKINALVDLRWEGRHDASLVAKSGIELLYLPTNDQDAVSQEDLWKAVRWINNVITKNQKVVIHCTYGIGRSVLLACCVLVSQGSTPLQAFAAVRKARSKAAPTHQQLEALLTWSKNWYKTQNRVFPDVSIFDLIAEYLSLKD